MANKNCLDCYDSEECSCLCHDPNIKSVHAISCCFICPYCDTNISVYFYNNHVNRCKSDILGVELKFFEQNRQRWCEQYKNKFVLIKKRTVYGFYDTGNDAYKAGIDILGNISFLIKQILPEDKIIFCLFELHKE